MSEALANPEQLNRLEAAMALAPQVDCPVVHRFTPGLYIREIFIPAGTLLTSAVHKTEHPFVISVGIIRVQNEAGECETLEAPHIGITEPGTRRLLLALTDTVWTTFHPTSRGEDELPELLAELVDDSPNPYLPENYLPAYRNEKALPCSN